MLLWPSRDARKEVIRDYVGYRVASNLKVVSAKADLYAGALFITEATGFKGLNSQTIFKLDNFPKLTTVFS